MKTDKELLELAARAAGIECDEVGPFVEFQEWQSEFGMHVGGSFELVRRDWTPLTDDGDALRLAVKLGMIVEVDECTASAECYTSSDLDVDDKVDAFERIDKDPYAATRRAIVRAAAAIGEKL